MRFVLTSRLGRLLSLATAVAVGSLQIALTAGAAQTPLPIPTTGRTSVSPAQSLAQYQRIVVGDSLSVSVADALSAQGFAVNAKVGRQFAAAGRILVSYGHQLPANVVLALGTNGPVSLNLCRATVQRAPNREVFLVTNRVPRPWEARNNRNLRRCAAGDARVHLVDWHARSRGHREFLANDGYHLSRIGRLAFSRLVDAAVDACTAKSDSP